MIKLRKYQARAVADLRTAAHEGRNKLALISPTGSGKSLEVSTLVAALHRDGLITSAYVAVPMVHVQSGFGSAPRVRCGREVFDVASLGWAKLHGHGAMARLCKSLCGEPEALATVVTHQALTGEGLKCITEVSDLSGALLVIDEGHHTGSAKVNRLSEARDKWLARGGIVLLVTATPFRNDCADVLDESWYVHERTIIDHIDDADGPFAPAELEVRTSVLEGFAPTNRSALYDDSKSGLAARREYADQIVARWVADWDAASQAPAALVIVPAYASQSWRDVLVSAFEEAGVERGRVLDAVGISKEAQRRTRETLDAERALGSRAWLDASVDVVIACKRFDEASDWPICSHVYVIGYPSSIPLTLQRWGRAFRSKAEIDCHPFADTASITFFVPEWSRELVEDATEGGQLSRYRDDAHLLAACLHDYRTGLAYVREGREIRRTVFRERAISQAAQHAFELNPKQRARARRDIDRARAKTEDMAELVEVLASLPAERAPAALSVLSEDVAAAGPAERELVSKAWREVAKVVREQSAGESPRYDKPLLRASMLRVFREALRSADRGTIDFDDAHMTLLSSFTGQEVSTLTKALGGWASINLTRITRELNDYKEAHGKSLPPSTKQPWRVYDQWLRKRGSSLRTYGESLGLSPKARLDRTEKELRERLKSWLGKGKKFPGSTHPEWVAWAKWWNHQGGSWNELRETPRGVHSIPQMLKEAREYLSLHGKRPTPKTSNLWARRNAWLRGHHQTTLPRLLASHGLPGRATKG